MAWWTAQRDVRKRELADKLREMIRAAEWGEKTTMAALFGIIYCKEIKDAGGAAGIAREAGIDNVNVNLNLGCRLADYVTPNKDVVGVWENKSAPVADDGEVPDEWTSGDYETSEEESRRPSPASDRWLRRYGASAEELEALRLAVAARCPQVRFCGWTEKGARIGEYSFRLLLVGRWWFRHPRVRPVSSDAASVDGASVWRAPSPAMPTICGRSWTTSRRSMKSSTGSALETKHESSASPALRSLDDAVRADSRPEGESRAQIRLCEVGVVDENLGLRTPLAKGPGCRTRGPEFPEYAGARRRSGRSRVCDPDCRPVHCSCRDSCVPTRFESIGRPRLRDSLMTLRCSSQSGSTPEPARASQAAKKARTSAAERNGWDDRRGLMRSRAVSRSAALDDIRSLLTFDRPPVALIGNRRPGLPTTLGKSPANAPAGAAAPGTSPGCPASPCRPRCARRRWCRSRPIPRVPSSRRPGRRSARPGRASRTRAGRGRA